MDAAALDLWKQADEARARAYAPYSGVTVGAAVRCEDGSVVTGVNIENASFSATICAERAAVARAIAGGSPRIVAVAVAGPGEDLPPCGTCRQVLSEFADPDTPVTFRASGELRTESLSNLLPFAFRLEPPPEAGG